MSINLFMLIVSLGTLGLVIYLFLKVIQPSMASEVFYTNTIDPDSYLNYGRTIRKVDLNDNTFFKLIDNAVLCDVSNDESLILYSPTNSLYEYSYPGDPQSFIIRNFLRTYLYILNKNS